MLFVNHSTVARWENGSRLPDASMILRLAKCLGVDAGTLFRLADQDQESPHIILVDDSRSILTGGIRVLEETIPNVTVKGFIRPQEAMKYAKANRVALAILDIELGTVSGLDLCRELRAIDSHTNIIFLTAYSDYSLDAWKTEASGFLLKPLTPKGLKEQLKKLRYPLLVEGAEK